MKRPKYIHVYIMGTIYKVAKKGMAKSRLGSWPPSTHVYAAPADNSIGDIGDI